MQSHQQHIASELTPQAGADLSQQQRQNCWFSSPSTPIKNMLNDDDDEDDDEDDDDEAEENDEQPTTIGQNAAASRSPAGSSCRSCSSSLVGSGASSPVSSRDSRRRGACELADLIDCCREADEQQLAMRSGQLSPLDVDRLVGDELAAPNSTTSVASTCELVTALQDHLKSAVAAATAAAAAAAAAATSSAPPISHASAADGNHRQHSDNFIPLDLKILPDYWHHSALNQRGASPLASSSSSSSPASSSRCSAANCGGNKQRELGGHELTVQRTEIVQTLASELRVNVHDCATTNGERPQEAQNLVTSLASGGGQAAASEPSKPNGEGDSATAKQQRRLYKCRHCPFETDQKVENWLHIRIHMRPERLLSCNSCQFVTEYKHHLEYHQRNHTGYKPFKCEHCDYTCVNKSMLNSHMKSHSTVYQYQCGDCKYATKYVHSLKMHLRKYSHQPAEYMIDIFARKRGPKPGSGRKQQLLRQQQLEQQIKEQVAEQRRQQALLVQQARGDGKHAAGASTSSAAGQRGNSAAARRAARQSTHVQQQQPQHCILDLRVNSKLSKK